MSEAPFRALPSADKLLRAPEVVDLSRRFDRTAVVNLVRQVLGNYRDGVARGERPPTLDQAVAAITERAAKRWRTGPVSVLNASGVILHTNLGRSPLSTEALDAMRAAAAYSDLELDLATGRRGSRQQHCDSLLRDLTGAQAAHITVNAAAALLLALAALCRGREVIVSRGQLVEIGGGFRIPTILRQSGARLIEVGTTNRTRAGDYLEAVTPRTAAILHVHSSNFRVVGFTEQVPLASLAVIAKDHGLFLIDDNGSGALLDTAGFGLGHEPTPVESLQAGVDVVVFSGDKLLGGPQAGIALGRDDLIRRLSRHALARAVRPDKTALAALSATLLAYLRGDATKVLPLWQMIGASLESLERRSATVVAALSGAGLHAEIRPGESTVGGGSLPTEVLPTALVALPTFFTAAALRQAQPPVIARTADGRTVLDLRTVPEAQDETLVQALLLLTSRRRAGANTVIDSAAR